MKRKIEKQFDGEMKFFTPELYLQYNSASDTEATAADEEWQVAIQQYKQHLDSCSKEMNDRVKDLATKQCLHDAELLSIQEDLPQYKPTICAPLSSPLAVAIISLRDSGNITNLIYLLWSEIKQARPKKEWPFSKRQTHWLYDDLDIVRDPPNPPLFWHRILLSDGRIVSVPFSDVVVQSFSEQNLETTIITKKRA